MSTTKLVKISSGENIEVDTSTDVDLRTQAIATLLMHDICPQAIIDALDTEEGSVWQVLCAMEHNLEID